MNGVNDANQHVGASASDEYTGKRVEYFADVDDVEIISHNAGQRTELKPPTLHSAVKHTILSCFYDVEFIRGAVSLRKAAPAVK